MRVDVTHSLGAERATARLDGFLDELTTRQWPGGLTFTNPRKSWSGDRLVFSFDAGAAGFGVTINGTVRVAADRATVESDLPAVARIFVGEDRVAAIVAEGLRDALAADGHEGVGNVR